MDGGKKLSDTVGLIANFSNLVQSILVPLIGSAIGGSATAYFLKPPIYIIIIVAVAVFLLLSLLIWWLRTKLAVQILCFAHNLLPIETSYECQDKVAVYTYENLETMTFRVSYKVKFNSGTNRHILDRIKWSGGNVKKIEEIVQGQKITEIPAQDDILFQLGFQSFQIDLRRDYTKKDDPLSTGYFCRCPFDKDHKAMTCLVMGVYQKLNSLTLRVRFQKDLKVDTSSIRKLKYARYLDRGPYDIKPGKLEIEDQNYNYVEFIIKNPIPGGKYAIDWEFLDQ